MKNEKPFYIVLIIVITFSTFISSCKKENVVSQNENSVTVGSMKGKDHVAKLLRHVVLFNFNEKATDNIIRQIEDKFMALPNEIAEMHSLEWGTNNSAEGLDKGFTHCFFVTFLSEEDREKYLPHPSHQKFVDFIGPYVEDVTVVDYWTE